MALVHQTMAQKAVVGLHGVMIFTTACSIVGMCTVVGAMLGSATAVVLAKLSTPKK